MKKAVAGWIFLTLVATSVTVWTQDESAENKEGRKGASEQAYEHASEKTQYLIVRELFFTTFQ